MFLYLYSTTGCRCVTITHEACWRVLGTCWGKTQYIKDSGKQTTAWQDRRRKFIMFSSRFSFPSKRSPPPNSGEKFPESSLHVKGEASHANHDGHIQQRSKYFPRHFLSDSCLGQQSCSLATTVSFLFGVETCAFFFP